MRAKRIYILLAVLWSLTSCVGELQDSPSGTQGGLSLDFSCVERQTKAAMPGSETENRLLNIYYYMFTEDATNDTPAVYHGSLSPNSTDGRASVNVPFNPNEIERLFPGSARTCKIFAVANFNPGLGDNPTLNQLLNCEVSTAFEDVLDPESFVMVSSDADGNVGPSTVRLISKSNTTAADGDVSMKRLAVKISLSLHVEADAVISNTVEVNGTLVQRTEIWEPQWLGTNGADGAQFYLMHGTGSSRLSAVPYSNEGDKDVSVLFDYSPGSRGLNGIIRKDREYMSYGYARDEVSGKVIFDASGKPQQLTAPISKPADFRQVAPFYSYPQTWQYGYTYEPYIKLVIPWKRLAGMNPDGSSYGELTKPYYYKVLCSGSQLDTRQAVLGSNHWYEIFLNVGILGSETDEGETVLEGRFTVADWQKRETDSSGGDISEDNIDKDTEIVGARYLSLPSAEYILYNQNEVRIPITTSHECELSEATITYTDYYINQEVSHKITEENPWNREGFILTIEGNHIIFRNPLLNYGVDDTYDVASFTFNFNIRHSDYPSYVKNITITQHPAIMITSYRNSEATVAENGTIQTNNTNKGWVFVNNSTGTSTYGGVHGISSSASNKNPHMYIIETTVLTAQSGFIIGDPRKRTVDNLEGEGSWAATATSLDGTNRSLAYYRPVDESTASDNIIAPKFRIASSYGVVRSGTLTDRLDAYKRCASYQEDGFPAGRWRVPTRAEIKYMAQLTTDGMIPRLLGSLTDNSDLTYYWCNSGSVGVYGGTNKSDLVHHTGDRNSDSTPSVRCVYDEWYWNVMDEVKGYEVPFPSDESGMTPNKSTFRWGDEAR